MSRRKKYMPKQTSLFHIEDETSLNAPLAYRYRPKNFDDYAGQHSVLKRLKGLKAEHLPNMIFWGPPGCGKTTLANLIAKNTGIKLNNFNAVLSGVPELRKLIAKVLEESNGEKQIIFIDEIHRFNKSQQDALLPYLEKGDFILIGATTEYPQTSLNKAILSRVSLFELGKLSEEEILNILNRVVKAEKLNLDDEALIYLAHFANGDARYALNIIEELSTYPDDERDLSLLKKLVKQNSRHYDKNSERHYDVISAFIKSVRGSDPNAAIMWLAIMLDGGEDPVFIARRLMILASEDIGLADPNAMQIANAAHYTVNQIGMPEARITLAEATIYLALADKSNTAYNAINKAMSYIKERPTIEVPTHLRNHHPDSKKYRYPHNYQNHWVAQNYCEEKEDFYKPLQTGIEGELYNRYLKRKSQI